MANRDHVAGDKLCISLVPQKLFAEERYEIRQK
jgi:hypothetical protein